jgi:hypothetical protein
MELVVKFCMIYFTRFGISFPGFYLIPMPHSVKCQIATSTVTSRNNRGAVFSVRRRC